MAYVPGFDWDIFLSYPRETDQRDSYDLEWVSEFHRILEKELKERISDQSGPAIYFDRRNFGAADHLEDELLEAVRKSALFLAILSPRYLAPGKFTMRELDVFCEHSERRKRIIGLELLPIEDECPPTLRGLKSNKFYVMDEGRAIKLTPKWQTHRDEYYRKLQILAQDLRDLLKTMRASTGGAVEEAKRPFTGKTVLLGPRGDDVEGEWEEVRATLIDFGAAVLPEVDNHLDAGEFAAQLTRDVARADLFVQLLSPVDEFNQRPSSTDPPSPAQLQYLAGRSRSELPVLQWRKPSKLKYWNKEFLEGPYVLASGLEEFKREIKKVLTALSEPPRKKPDPTAAPYVYITADDADVSLALELKEIAEVKSKFTDQCGIMAREQRMENFLEQLELADVVVFLYGAGEPKFIDNWLYTYSRLKAKGKTKPPQIEVLYRAPPRKTEMEHKLRAPLGAFMRVGSEEAFSCDGMQEIFNELQKKKKAMEPAHSL